MTMRSGSFLSARRHIIGGMLTLVLLIGGFGLWATTANIAGAIIAPGTIVVQQNQQVVQHPDGGVVASIEAKEGDRVEAGQILIRLDPVQIVSKRNVIEGSLFEVLARRARLEAERDNAETVTFDPMLTALIAKRANVRALTDGQTRLFLSRRDTVATETAQLGKRIGQIESQIAGLDAQSQALRTQLDLLRQELAGQQTLLDKGLTQATKVLSLQREEARLQGQLGNLTAIRAEQEGRITETEIEILRLSNQRREDAISALRDLGFKQLELTEQLAQLSERLDRLDIRAPMAGLVYDMRVFARNAVIRPADPVMYIIPQDQPLQIAAQVDPIHIDEVFTGQTVVVRFAGLDSRTTPEIFGRILAVSADSFTDQATGARYYRAEIALLDGELAKLPDGVTLIPGMPADAFIRTGDRTPLVYLIKPLTDYFTKAFREK